MSHFCRKTLLRVNSQLAANGSALHLSGETPKNSETRNGFVNGLLRMPRRLLRAMASLMGALVSLATLPARALLTSWASVGARPSDFADRRPPGLAPGPHQDQYHQSPWQRATGRQISL